jgi:hypothetical protein
MWLKAIKQIDTEHFDQTVDQKISLKALRVFWVFLFEAAILMCGWPG